MSEQSLYEKSRRGLLRRLQGAFGPQLLGPLWRDDERLALAARRPRDLGGDLPVTFLIPLVGRHHVGNWQTVEETLGQTLAGFQAQTSDNWRALICSQDRPECLPADPRITFLPFTQQIEGHDKLPKLNQLAAALGHETPDHGYVMPFDADDVLGKDAVARMQARRAAGYLIEDGHIFDMSADCIGRTGARRLSDPRQRPFWKFCGSCISFHYDLRAGEADIRLLQALMQYEHRLYPYFAALAGLDLVSDPAISALYRLNHGENFGKRRGRGGFKSRFAARHALDAKARADLIATRYPSLLPGG